MAMSNTGNGNYRGASITPTTLSASGIWNLTNQSNFKKASAWPTGQIIRNGLTLNLDASNLSSYPGTGTTWFDLSDTPTNATLINGPTYTYPYIQMDGSNDYASVSSTSKIAIGTSDFSIEVWVYPQSLSGYSHLVSIPNQGTFTFKHDPEGIIYIYTGSAYSNFGSTPSWTMSLNVWQQLVVTRQSSVMYAYKNGVSAGSASGFNYNIPQNTINIHNGFGDEFQQARFGAVNMYNRALSSSEVLDNFNTKKGVYGL
jgi:hypothetical protein